jgi:serralysin
MAIIQGSEFNDNNTFNNGAFRPKLIGTGVNDNMTGKAGDDRLEGLGGDDQMRGGNNKATIA